MSIIKLHNVYRKKNGRLEFGKFDIDLSSNQVVSLVGNKLTGKTCFLNIISGIETSYKGDVFIDGHLIDNYTKKIISYCPSVLMFNNDIKIKTIINQYQDYFPDFNKEKTLEFFAKNSIDINKKFINYSFKKRYLIQLLLTLSRQAKIYLIDDLFIKLESNDVSFVLDIINDYKSHSLIILTSNTLENVFNVSNIFLFFEKNKSLKFLSKDNLFEENIIDYEKEVFHV